MRRAVYAVSRTKPDHIKKAIVRLRDGQTPTMFRFLRRPRNVAIFIGTAGVGSYFALTPGQATVNRGDGKSKRYFAPPPWTPPSRKEMIEKLKLSAKNKDEIFDLLVVGGGATGAGVALDAASRGLKVALVEKNDFSSGEYFRSEMTHI